MSNEKTAKRYNIKFGRPVESKNGSYVMYSDHIDTLATVTAERDRYKEALQKIKPLFDGRKNEFERLINEALKDK